MTDPTHDALHTERLERLTELARRVWPHEKVRVQVDADDGTAAVVDLHLSECCEPDPTTDALAHVTPQRANNGSRALDALEAALLVLVGEGGVAVWPLQLEPPPWVEKLASEWEAREMTPPHGICMRTCAAELRARAKGTP